MFPILFDAIQLSATVVGIVSTALSVVDWFQGRALSKARSFPQKLGRKIKSSSYHQALRGFAHYLDEEIIKYDLVVGIHYGGLSVAADFAQISYKPVRLVETRFRRDEKKIVCEKTIPKYKKQEVKGQHILLIDNRIRSGVTLSTAKRQLISDGARSVITVVLFQPKDGSNSANHVIFKTRWWFKGREFLR